MSSAIRRSRLIGRRVGDGGCPTSCSQWRCWALQRSSYMALANMWFFGDDWAFIVNRRRWWAEGDYFQYLLAPHNEHWSMLPVVLHGALFRVAGLHSYVPYLLPVLALHLGNCAILRVVTARGRRAAVAGDGWRLRLRVHRQRRGEPGLGIPGGLRRRDVLRAAPAAACRPRRRAEHSRRHRHRQWVPGGHDCGPGRHHGRSCGAGAGATPPVGPCPAERGCARVAVCALVLRVWARADRVVPHRGQSRARLRDLRRVERSRPGHTAASGWDGDRSRGGRPCLPRSVR